MKRYIVNLYDRHSDETRSITVMARNETSAENKAIKRADNEKWPNSFVIGDVIEA